MKKTTIISTMLALVFTLSLAGTAGAVPYVKGNPPNIEKERGQTSIQTTAPAPAKATKTDAGSSKMAKGDCKSECACCSTKTK